MANPKAGPTVASKDGVPQLDGRLLAWKQDGTTFKADTSKATGVVFPYRRGYHWEIFHEGEVKYKGQVRTLHAAMCHVEGNFVGRGMLDEESQAGPARGKETLGGVPAE
jgi:hypothetical protein